MVVRVGNFLNSVSDRPIWELFFFICILCTQDADSEDDDDDEDYEANEETALESYNTPLDEDNCPIDEYIVFKEIMQSKWFLTVFSTYVCIQCYLYTSFNFRSSDGRSSLVSGPYRSVD